MARDNDTLLYAVRGRVVARFLGDVALGSGWLAVVPLAASVVLGDTRLAIRLAVVAAVLLAAAAALRRLPVPARLQTNEALVVVVLAFLGNALAMTWPLAAGGLPVVDAFFEAVSAVTTTGLSTVASPQAQSRAFLLTRAWMQWYGGLGVVVFGVALLTGHRAAMRRLVEVVSPEESIATTTRAHARRVLLVYVALTVVATLAVWATVGEVLPSVALTLSAVSTGGFAPYAASLSGLPTAAAAALTAAAFLGAVSLPLYHRAWHQGPRALATDPELTALLTACLVTSLGLALLLYLQGSTSVEEALRQGALIGVSAQTTTGFSTLDVSGLGAPPTLWLIAAMLAGGCVGSTGGGLKMLRVLVLYQLVRHVVRRAAAPAHAVVEPRLAGRRLELEDFTQALLLLGLLAALVFASWLLFVAAGHAPLASLFEVVSAVATVGLSSGVVSSDLAMPLKLLLCLDMLAGRVEIVALLVLLYPATWIGTRSAER